MARWPLTIGVLAVAVDWVAIDWLGTAYGLRPPLVALVWWLLSRASPARRWFVVGALLLAGGAGEWWRGEGLVPIAAGLLVLAAGVALAEGMRRVRRTALRRAGLALLVAAPLLLPLGRWVRSVDASPSFSVAAVSSVPLGPIADPSGRNGPLVEALRSVGPVTLLDRIAAAGPEADRLLLLQPRRFDPAELVAIDGWVRRGGRAVVLADPEMRWPGDHPIGDPRNPLPVSLLDPLLEHWGVRLELEEPGSARSNPLALPSPGWLTLRSPSCRTAGGARAAVCWIGEGEALIVADADWLDPAGWDSLGQEGRRLRAMLRRPADFPDNRDNLPWAWVLLFGLATGALERTKVKKGTDKEQVR